MADGPFLPVIPAGRQAGRPAVFARVAIVGLGGIGSAIASSIRQVFPSALVIGSDRNDRIEACIRAGAIDIGADDPIIVAEADLVLLDLPRRELEQWLVALPDVMPGPATLSTVEFRESLADVAPPLPDRFSFVAGHVIPASGRPGSDRPPATAIAGAIWGLTAAPHPAAVARLEAFVAALGARPVVVAAAADLVALARDGRLSSVPRDEFPTAAV